MSTERFDKDLPVIGSSDDGGTTIRVDGGIISSGLAAGTERLDAGIIPSDAPKAGSAGPGGQEGSTPGGQEGSAPGGQAASPPESNGNIRAEDHFILSGKRYDKKRLIAHSGEADIYEITDGGRSLVLKYYYPNFKPKEEILRKLQTLGRSDVIVPIEYGYLQDRFYEINEYMAGGTLEEIFPVQDIDRTRELVGRVADALNACHQHQIIHRDIKPVNIFFRHTDKREIVLADFGISSALDEGESYKITTAARTRIYAAPELEMGTNVNNQTVVDRKVDYYALGISLLEMWKGEDPFKDVDRMIIPRIKLDGRVNIPVQMHPELQKLIKGLITTEPPKRWGYEEIRKWLRGEPVTVHFRTMDLKFDNYVFDSAKGIIISDPKDLAYHMEIDADKATTQLYSGGITDWLKRTSADLAGEIYAITEIDYKSNLRENWKAGVTKAIYVLDKYKPFKSFDGSQWNDQAQLARHIEANPGFYREELKKPTASLYLFLEARGQRDRAEKYRSYQRDYPAYAFYLVVLDLQENKLQVGGMTLVHPNQIAGGGEELLRELVQPAQDPYSKFSTWLAIMASDLNDAMAAYRAQGWFNTFQLRYALHIGGPKIDGQEALSVEDCYRLFKAHPESLTSGPGAEALRKNVNTWLERYQGSSLYKILQRYLADEPYQESAARELFRAALMEVGGLNCLTALKGIAPELANRTGNDPAALQAWVDIVQQPLLAYMDAEYPKSYYGLETVNRVGSVLHQIHDDYPLLADRLLLSINDKIHAFIDADYVKIKHDPKSFNGYRNTLVGYVDNLFRPISKDMPYLRHWEEEEALIGKKTRKYIRKQIESNIDYLAKGKLFFRIFMYMILSVIAAGTVVLWMAARAQTANFGVAANPMLANAVVYGVIIVLFGLWRIRRVRRRRPGAGLGMIFDPLHRVIGKMAYWPILNRIVKDENHSSYQWAYQVLRTSGGTAMYDETVRIVLLNSSDLHREAAA